ncbi:hypothetical protein BC830DRAFT_117426 [Chytriomyces sp. MP71]|nr:hypothetical protein BC830DRAFT_117426 [Chytriomyces sp. MP71]
MVPDADFAFDIKAHAATFNCLIDVYNAQVDSLTRLLTSPEASLIAFPSRELANSYPQNPPIVWNAPKILATVREALERVKLPHIRIQDPSENDVGPGFGAVKRMYQEYVGSLAAAGFVGDGGALLSLVWSRIAGFERSVMIAGRMGTIKPGTSPSFPFGKVGLGFAGSAVEVLKSVLKQLANRIGGGGESPWYDWGQIQEAVYEFDDKIESTVVRWEKEVRTPWVRLGVTKTPAATGLKLPGGMQAFTTPSRNGKLAAVSKSPASPSLRYGTPLSQVIEHELSNTSATPISSMVQSSWSTPASAIKRRMMETLALCKLEAEKTKRLTK